MRRNPIYSLSEPTTVQKLTHALKYITCYWNKAVVRSDAPSETEHKSIAELQEHGVTILERFVAPDELHLLREEHEAALRNFEFNFPVLAEARITDPIASRLFADGTTTTYNDLLDEDIFINSGGGLEYDQFVDSFRPHILKTTLDKYSSRFTRLWLDERLLRIVAGYLKCVPKLVEAYTRRSYPSRHAYQNNNWHRDANDRLKLVKVFFLLNGTNCRNGPHHYVRGSHRNFGIFNGQEYYSDVEELYPEFRSKRTPETLPAGTVMLADTRGLHRATVPMETHRDLGYAVFYPCRPFYHDPGFGIRRSRFQDLTRYQKAFINRGNVIEDTTHQRFRGSV